MHIVVNGGLTEGRQGHEKGTAKAMRYIVAGSALTLCVIMTGCGHGQKKTDPASEQVLKISITPEPSPTPAPDTVDA